MYKRESLSLEKTIDVSFIQITMNFVWVFSAWEPLFVTLLKGATSSKKVYT